MDRKSTGEAVTKMYRQQERQWWREIGKRQETETIFGPQASLTRNGFMNINSVVLFAGSYKFCCASISPMAKTMCCEPSQPKGKMHYEVSTSIELFWFVLPAVTCSPALQALWHSSTIAPSMQEKRIGERNAKMEGKKGGCLKRGRWDICVSILEKS